MTNRDRLIKTVTNATAFSGLVYFFVGPVQVMATLVLKVFYPNYALIAGRYLTPLVYSASTVNFFTFVIFMREFRREVKHMILKWCGMNLAATGGLQQSAHNDAINMDTFPAGSLVPNVQPVVSNLQEQTTPLWKNINYFELQTSLILIFWKVWTNKIESESNYWYKKD